jgi:hypothetical protein
MTPEGIFDAIGYKTMKGDNTPDKQSMGLNGMLLK